MTEFGPGSAQRWVVTDGLHTLAYSDLGDAIRPGGEKLRAVAGPGAMFDRGLPEPLPAPTPPHPGTATRRRPPSRQPSSRLVVPPSCRHSPTRVHHRPRQPHPPKPTPQTRQHRAAPNGITPTCQAGRYYSTFQLTSDRVPASGLRPHGPFVYWFRQRFVRVVRTRMRSSATGQPARENIRRSSSLSSLVCCRWSIGSGPKANRPSDSEGPMTTGALRAVSPRSRKPGD